LLFLSNLVESKGFLDVLAAVRLLRDRLGPGRVRCNFHGYFYRNDDDVHVRSAGHAQQLFEEYVAQHGLQECVTYHGVAAGEAKRTALRDAHFFLLPTRYNNEGQPVSIIEAMAYGNVVISTDYRAIPDIVEHGETGFLLDFGAPEQIADAVERCVLEPHRYAAMSVAALARFRAGFTREAHLARILPFITGDA
jgi:glycosyltransferase involved in cell wall biosynthesis